MGHGLGTIYSGVIASGATLSSEIALSRTYGTMFLSVPSMTSNTQLHIQASTRTGGNYRRVTHPSVNTSTVAANNDFAIASSVTNRMVLIPNGFKYYKIEATATVDSSQSFTVVCLDE